jgi:hypothetical protein
MENFSIGRVFPIREGMKVSFRFEFFNVFNRVRIPNPESTGFGSGTQNIQNTQTYDSNGNAVSGFGYINARDAGGQRTGQIVLRFTF